MRKTRDLTITAMYIAMYVVLAKYSEIFIPFLKMPNGGSVELSIIVLLIASYQLGVKKALVVALVGVLLEYTIAGKTFYAINVLQIVLDYLLAFGIYAFASVIPYRNQNIPFGIVITNGIRFLAHTLSGVLFFPSGDTAFKIWYASAAYNAPYMIANLLVSFFIVWAVLPTIRKNMSTK